MVTAVQVFAGIGAWCVFFIGLVVLSLAWSVFRELQVERRAARDLEREHAKLVCEARRRDDA